MTNEELTRLEEWEFKLAETEKRYLEHYRGFGTNIAGLDEDTVKWTLKAIPALIAMVRERDARIEALESLRPQWAQGYTLDSVAAQVSSIALSQLWKKLGVSNQTDAMQALDRATAAEARVAELEEALEPFADIAEAYDPPEGDDDHAAWDQRHVPTVGMLRAARAALGRAADDPG